jgi:translation initiation factor 4A
VHQLTTVYHRLLLLLLCALAGTGKTATFAISILQKIDVNLQECQALVLAPTRELAQQIVKVVRALGDYMNIQVHACVGGTAVRDDIRTLQVGIHTLTSITLSVGSSTVLTASSGCERCAW